jgi:hypothetical protein
MTTDGVSDPTEMLNYNGPPETIAPDIKPLAVGTPEMRSIFLREDKLEARYFPLEQHRAIYAFWLAQPRVDGLPLSAGIDPLDFWSAMGTVMLLEPNADRGDFFYRVHGTKVSDALALSLNQKWLSVLESPLRDSYIAHYGEICRYRCPAYSEHPAARKYSLTTLFCRLTLPMVDRNGTVNRLLASAVPLTQVPSA